MIVERLTFRARYGRGDELVALLREWSSKIGAAMRDPEVAAARVYTDAAGPMFTVQLEVELPDWHACARFMEGERDMFDSAEFRDWFARMTDCTEHGERQVLNLVPASAS